jgi:hypothetical protein
MGANYLFVVGPLSGRGAARTAFALAMIKIALYTDQNFRKAYMYAKGNIFLPPFS